MDYLVRVIRSTTMRMASRHARIMMRPFTRMLMALVWLSILSCAWGTTAVTGPVTEVDFPANDQRPIWLDNTRVLFSSEGPVTERSPNKEPQERSAGLYIWDVEHNTITKEPRFNYLSHLCVNGRFMSYTPWTGGTKLDKRQAFVDGQQIDVPDTHWFNPVSCHILTTKPEWVVAYDNGRAIVPLLEEHGYIDFGISGTASAVEEFPLQYYRTGVTQPIPLGLRSRYVRAPAHYVPFLDAYVLHSSSGHNSARPLWLMHPNGTVEQVFSPDGKAWAEQSFSWEVLTKRGVVFGKITQLGSNIKDSGLYLWEDGTLTKLVSGVFSLLVAISPDGCKMAGIKGRPQRPLPGDELYRLQIIDLCQIGKDVR